MTAHIIFYAIILICLIGLVLIAWYTIDRPRGKWKRTEINGKVYWTKTNRP